MLEVLAATGACFLIMVGSGFVLWLGFIVFQALGHSKLLQHKNKTRS